MYMMPTKTGQRVSLGYQDKLQANVFDYNVALAGFLFRL